MPQTCATDLDTLAEQVAHREAWREATNKRILKTKKKEDNHITYHEAQLEGLSLAEDLDAKRSEKWPKIGKPIAEKTS